MGTSEKMSKAEGRPEEGGWDKSKMDDASILLLLLFSSPSWDEFW